MQSPSLFYVLHSCNENIQSIIHRIPCGLYVTVTFNYSKHLSISIELTSVMGLSAASVRHKYKYFPFRIHGSASMAAPRRSDFSSGGIRYRRGQCHQGVSKHGVGLMRRFQALSVVLLEIG